jgi:RHS repeat-associated protein
VESGFDGLRRRYLRDKAGRVVKVFRPADRTTEYAYDDAGRVAAVQHSSGEAEAYAYRPDGELVEAKNDAATVKLERDLLGRIVREVVGDDWVGSEYDALGARVRVTSSTGLDERITRDAMGRAVGIHASVDNQVWDARIVRDIMGLEIERHLPGGVQSRWERDAVGRPVKQEVWAAGQFRRAVQYTWDVGDRLKMVVDALRGPTHYEHDALGNLAAATYADGRVDLRMPDAVGNLFRTRDRTDRKYGPAGQLLEARREDGGLTTYDYDPEGNLIRKTEHAREAGAAARVWRYEWNGAGMLARVVRPDDQFVTLSYDAFGRRLTKRSDRKCSRWLWDGHLPVQESNEEPAPLSGPNAGPPLKCTTWIFLGDSFSPAARLGPFGADSVIADQLGTPTALYDGTGTEAWSADVRVGGGADPGADGAHTFPWSWPGQYEDEDTGLRYNRFRYYDPTSGCYISTDPLRLLGGLREYQYVGDPTSACDPFGLAGREDMLQSALDVLKGHDSEIRQVFGEDVQYGVRGSLSTGVKYKTGGPFNPSDFDIDAFVISKDLPAGFSRKVMPNSMEVKELEQAIERELRALEGFEGMRTQQFGFRNWKREQPGSTVCK